MTVAPALPRAPCSGQIDRQPDSMRQNGVRGRLLPAGLSQGGAGPQGTSRRVLLTCAFFIDCPVGQFMQSHSLSG